MDEKKLNEAKEAAEKKAAELSAELGVKVHPMVFYVEADKEPVVGYVKEPSRQVKLAVMDKYAAGFYSACSQALDVLLLKDHSDKRISSERAEDDSYFMGAVYAISELISFAVNRADKKK